jgi:hypothetical protein
VRERNERNIEKENKREIKAVEDKVVERGCRALLTVENAGARETDIRKVVSSNYRF